MNSLNNLENLDSVGIDDSVINTADVGPGEGPKNVEGDDKEIVNEEDQNQVVNAQPLEEFTSNYVNKDESESVGVFKEKVEE